MNFVRRGEVCGDYARNLRGWSRKSGFSTVFRGQVWEIGVLGVKMAICAKMPQISCKTPRSLLAYEGDGIKIIRGNNKYNNIIN